MKPALLMLVAGGLMLTGCAGMKSEFDCNDTASNGCMTMDEANNKARTMTENQKGKAAEGRRILPPLAAVPVVKKRATSVGVPWMVRAMSLSRRPFRPPKRWCGICGGICAPSRRRHSL